MLWPYLYDLILILIVFLSLRRGWRTGIFSSLLRLLGWAVALVFIATFSKDIAAWIFDNLLRSPLVSTVENALPQDLIASVNSSAASTQDTLAEMQTLLDSLGGLLGNASIDTASLQGILDIMQTDGQTLAEAITDSVLRPIVISAVQVLVSIFILIVCLLVFRFLARSMAARRHRRGLVGTVNSVLGAVLGGGEGFAVGYIYVFLLSALSNAELNFINSEILSSTLIIQRLIQ